jgi:hypothetical protein
MPVRALARAGRATALALSLLALAACGDDEATIREGDVESPSEVLGDADEGIEGVRAIRVLYERPVHAEGDVEYGLEPPAGGLHAPVWWNCGFYDEPIREESAVHSLEHGAVWIAYSPDLSDEEKAKVHALARNPKVLASPYPDLPAGEAVGLSSWARQLRLDSLDDPRVVGFLSRYRDSDQAPEAGASCEGTPLGEPIP